MHLRNYHSVRFDLNRLPEATAEFLVAIILMLSIVLPTAFQAVKAGMLVVVLLLILSGVLARRVLLSSKLYFFSLFYAVIGFIWSIYGETAGNPGAIRVLTVMVLYPLLIPLYSSLYQKNSSYSLYKIFLICAWVIAVIDIVYVISGAIYSGNILQIFFESLYGEWAVVDSAGDYIKFTLPNVSSIIFILPFFLSVLLFSESRESKFHIFSIVLLLFIVAILSGRRALLLFTLLGPAIAIIITANGFHNNVKRKIGRRWWVLLIGVFVISSLIYFTVVTVGLEYYVDLINSIFDFTENQSNLERVYQFEALMRGINSAPFFGHGAGAVADYIRSEEMPWAYELYYMSVIFQYGIIGFLFYALGVIFLCWHLVSSVKKKGRSSFEFYFLSGFITFILATASNPYLAKFDYMWVIFIPYAIVNLKLITKEKSNSMRLSYAN